MPEGRLHVLQDEAVALVQNPYLPAERFASKGKLRNDLAQARDVLAGLGRDFEDAGVMADALEVGQRLVPLEARRRVGAHYLAEAEATCDFTPRFDQRCLDFIPPDLNGLLYEYELFFAAHAARLGWVEHWDWQQRADARRERINTLLWSESRGLYLDYDHVNQRPGAVAALTGVQLLAHGIPTAEQASRIVANLPLFECEYGIAYTEECPACRDYQWAFPTVWPPLVWMTVVGLRRYGYAADARRITQKHLNLADALFAQTGKLWEKTDGERGVVAVGEYDAPPMMGWSAGVYVALTACLAESNPS